MANATSLAQAEARMRARYLRGYHMDNLFMGELMVDHGLTILEAKAAHDRVRDRLRNENAMPCPLKMHPENMMENRRTGRRR